MTVMKNTHSITRESNMELIKRAIEKYTGGAVLSIKVTDDPVERSTLAVRTEVRFGEGDVEVCDWLLDTLCVPGWPVSTPDEVLGKLEECTFMQWPPLQANR